MGYLSDQKGILNRYLLESGQWEDHLARTSSFILQSLPEKSPEKIVVLGSGWLLDLPLEEIYKRCHQISLVDIQHPPQVLHEIMKYPGVIPVKADITGGLIKIAFEQMKHCRKNGLPFEAGNLTVPEPAFDEENVFVISLNILDQLDALIVDYIRRWFDLSPEVVNALRREIQRAHISMVAAHPYCIITDAYEILFNSKGEETGRETLLFADLPEGKNCDEWIWKFDNHYHYREEFNTWFGVRAVSC